MATKSIEEREQHDAVRKLLEILITGIRIERSGFKSQLEHFGKAILSPSVSSCIKWNCNSCSTYQTGCEPSVSAVGSEVLHCSCGMTVPLCLSFWNSWLPRKRNTGNTKIYKHMFILYECSQSSLINLLFISVQSPSHHFPHNTNLNCFILLKTQPHLS